MMVFGKMEIIVCVLGTCQLVRTSN